MKIKKLFAEFLLESQVLSAKDLVESLLEQVAALPTVTEIIYKQNLLSPEQMLPILIHQMREQKDFVSAAQELGLWSAPLAELVSAELERERLPLSQILMKTKGVNVEALSAALDAYLCLADVEEIKSA